MSRSVPEWIAKHDDQTIPRSVRIRVFEKHDGRCALTGKKLSAGEFDIDHIKRLKDGGEHRESNLQPIWRKKHREKTAEETKAGKKAEKIKDKHFGFKKSTKKPFPSRPKPQPIITTGSKSDNAHRAAMSAKNKRIPPRRLI